MGPCGVFHARMGAPRWRRPQGRPSVGRSPSLSTAGVRSLPLRMALPTAGRASHTGVSPGASNRRWTVHPWRRCTPPGSRSRRSLPWDSFIFARVDAVLRHSLSVLERAWGLPPPPRLVPPGGTVGSTSGRGVPNWWYLEVVIFSHAPSFGGLRGGRPTCCSSLPRSGRVTRSLNRSA